jgi:hypothetical protein
LFFGIAYLLGKSSDASLLPPLAHWLSLIGNQEALYKRAADGGLPQAREALRRLGV